MYTLVAWNGDEQNLPGEYTGIGAAQQAAILYCKDHDVESVIVHYTPKSSTQSFELLEVFCVGAREFLKQFSS